MVCFLILEENPIFRLGLTRKKEDRPTATSIKRQFDRALQGESPDLVKLPEGYAQAKVVQGTRPPAACSRSKPA